jgi:8-oxo-dGTP diphosphatase
VTGRREYPDRPMVGVGGVVIAKDRVLLIRRGSAPLKGEWSIPGGMLEIGETIVQGVQREMLEETAIEVKVLDLIEVFERISVEEDGRAKYHFVILDYLCELLRGEPHAASEIFADSYRDAGNSKSVQAFSRPQRLACSGFR